MLVAAVLVDRLSLLLSLERVLKHWLELVLPALHKVLSLGRAGAQPAGPRESRWSSVPVVLSALVPAWLVQHGVAVSRARSAQALLESQRAHLRWWHSRRQWQVERWLQLGSAVFGTGSAIKYLLSRAPRRLR